MIHRAALGALHRIGVVSHLRALWTADFKAHTQVPATPGGEAKADREPVEAKLKKFKELINRNDNRWRDVDARVRELEAEARLTRAVIHRDHAQFPCIHGWLEALRSPATSDWVRRVIDQAELHMSPMPHLVLRDLWPTTVYEGLVEALPDDVFFADVRDQHKPNLKPAHLKLAPLWLQLAWQDVEERIIPTVMVPALVAAFKPAMARAYADEYGAELGASVEALPHSATAGRLMLRRPGYLIEPHLDPRRVTLTTLLYLAKPGDEARYGTDLYTVDPPPQLDRANTFYPGEGYRCERVKSVPFLPNTALVFLNRIGAHGASIPDDAPADTRRFAYQFYISPEAMALQQLLQGTSDEVRESAIDEMEADVGALT